MVYNMLLASVFSHNTSSPFFGLFTLVYYFSMMSLAITLTLKQISKRYKSDLSLAIRGGFTSLSFWDPFSWYPIQRPKSLSRTLDVSFGASSRLMNKKWSGVFGGNRPIFPIRWNPCGFLKQNWVKIWS